MDDSVIERAITTRKRRRRSPRPNEEPSSRNAAITGILLVVAGLLIALALVSYSPADQANTDISPRDIVGLFRNNDDIKAKFDTTQNWLGLIGAIIANFLLHNSFGIASALLLAFPILWARDLFRHGRIQPHTWQKSALILVSIVAASYWFGSVRLVWAALPVELSGVAGEFLASISAAIIGSVGTVLLGTTAIFFATVFTLGISIVGIINRIRVAIIHILELIRHKRTAPKQQPTRNTSERDENPFTFLRKTVQQQNHEEPRIVTPEDFTPPERPTHTETKTITPSPQPTSSTSSTRAAATSPPQQLTLTVQQQRHRPATEETTSIPAPATDESILYTPPSLDLLLPGKEEHVVNEEELKTNARLLQEKLETFKIRIENVTVIPGPVITQYEFVPAAGVKISQIEALADDIALALKARGIRIIAPIPGKGTVGVEIPNHKPSLVRFRSLVASKAFHEFRGWLPLGLGKTITGDVYCTDLAELPHLLIAGATGSGKSVGINTIIMSLIWRLHPRSLKFLIIDPKKVELTFYNRLKHHYLAVSPDVPEAVITTPANAVTALKSVVAEMDQRYDLLAKVGQRNIHDYNRKVADGTLKSSEATPLHQLPYIVVVIDELADLMMMARSEVEDSIIRLAQLARAVGIHLVVATQRPSVDVITGLIKANFPARIAYQVASKVDSRTILDTVGAEQLLGNGDMLFTPGGQRPIRLQNSFITTEEVEAITNYIGQQRGYSTPYMLPAVSQNAGRNSDTDGDFDPLFVEAARIVVHTQQGSTSLLQRRLRIGYSRAARIIDQLEAAGIVGPFDGSKARQVLVESDAELDMRLGELGLQ
ncbi:MAG: DNA translocase FtsK [Chlorobi bacterium]|nr:DNA translocase FtsK [Chlorobiota bacterium]